jgi:hypothetical protein
VTEEVLRRQLVAQLAGGQAYTPIEEAIREFPVELAGRKPEGISHTPWEILEHLRIAQWDILRFTVDPDHVTPPWPDEHWPQADAPSDEDAWHRSVETFLRELSEVRDLAQDPKTDLFMPIPHGTGQTALREILLVADHNAYHLGQLLLIRRALESTT